MPARYFHFSQDFNSDPEGWELTDSFGDRAVRTWAEILSILDRTNNCWKLVDNWERVIGRKVRQSPATVQREVGWMLAKGWLEVGQRLANGSPEVLRAPKYAKYRKSSGAAGTPPPSLASPPTPKEQPALFDQDVDKSDNKLNEAAFRIFNSDPKRFERLGSFIEEARRKQYKDNQIADALEEFERVQKTEVIANWYAYLRKLINVRTARSTAAAEEKRNNELKTASLGMMEEFIRDLAGRKAAK